MRTSSASRSRAPLLIGAGLMAVALAGAAYLLLQDDADGGPRVDAPLAISDERPEIPEFRDELPPDEAPAPRAIEAIPGTSVDPGEDVLDIDPEEPLSCIEGIALDENDNPVPAVTVEVFKGNQLLAGNFPGLRKRVETIAFTGNDGRFELCEIPSGDAYVVTGDHADYARSETAGIRVKRDGPTRGVVLRMRQGANVCGQVVELDGPPIVGAEVQLYYAMDAAFVDDDEEPQPWRVELTDDNGRFCIPHVSGSTIRLRVSAEGYETQTLTKNYALQGWPRDEDISFALDRGQTLLGRVVSETGLVGIADARIEAVSLTKEVQGTSWAKSDVNGYYELDGLGKSDYRIKATADGYSDVTKPRVHITAGTLQIVMARRGVVDGWVSTPGGQPITKFEILLLRHRPEGDANYLNDAESFSDPNGKFTYDNLDAGTYVLEARAKGFADSRSAPFTILRDAELPVQVRITMGQGGGVAGIVYGPDGEPIKNAKVDLQQNGYIESSIAQLFSAMAASGEREHRARTDATGRYEFSNIPAGVYQVAAKHPTGAPKVVSDVVVTDGGTTRVDVSLPPGAVIAGRAVDDNNFAIPFAKVQISQKGTGFMKATSTDADGEFRFENLKPGTYNLTCSPERMDGEIVNPLMRLVYAQRSSKEVFVGEGQEIDDTLLVLRAQ